MCKNSSFLISIVLVLSLVSAGYGDVVIGNWEGSSMDSWAKCTWGPAGNPTLTPGQTTGVTLDSGSLGASGQALGWNWFIIRESGISGADFIANDIFEVDVTRLAADWTVSDVNDNWNTFRVYIQGGNPSFSLAVDDLAPWDGNDDSTQTISMDYSSIKPATTPSWLNIVIATNTGGYSAGGVYYLDYARLVEATTAYNPQPQDGAIDVLTDDVLVWTPGKYADEHDVYFGTDYNDVNDANSSWPVATGPDDPNVYKGRQDANTYDPCGLDIGQIYYWRIDEVNDTGPDPCLWRGKVWSFRVVSYYAWNPDPIDGDIYESIDVKPRWSAGVSATSHRMYLGTDYNDVNDVPVGNTSSPLYKGYSTDTVWGNEGTEKALGLTNNTTYFWRIDETNGGTTWKGDVWEFSTLPPSETVVIGDWEDVNDGWSLIDATSSSYSTTGATLNNKSFRVEIPPTWHLAIQADSPNEVHLKSNDTFKIDVTWVASEWSGSWSNIENLAINAEGIDWVQLGPPDTDTSNPDTPGAWNPYDFGEVDTRTLSWDYSEANVCDIPDNTWRQIIIITNHDPAAGTGIYYFDRARLFDSKRASNPDPRDGARGVQTDPILIWTPGKFADKHDVYFGTDYEAVNDANRSSDVLIEQNYDSNSIDIAADPDVGLLDFDTTYYWRIDEINDAGPDPCSWKGNVWRFTTDHYLVIDDFESYNPSLEDTWKEGGKATVSLSTDPVHEGDQAMAIDYDNAASPYYSEAFADTNGPDSLDFGTDWTIDGVEGLSLWFRGYPDVRGSFGGNDPYTLVGDGWDIEDTADGFHYAYLKLTGTNPTWRVQARVDSIDNTDPWAKAGVMVRKTLEPGSIHATVVITPENGVLFQWRNTLDGDTDSNGITDPNIAAPYWVRVTRKLPSSGTAKITAEHSSDGSTWVQIGEPLDLELVGSSTSPIYLGLCVTSHTSFELCTAELSNVYMARSVTYLDDDGIDVGDPNADQDIGIPYNDPEPMYVVLEDSDSNGIVYHPDPNATQTGTWTHWGIELDEFSDDVDLADVQRIYIGCGDRDEPAQDGAGTVYVDDIRLYARGCTLSNRSADFAKADYAPEGSPAGDCMVDYREIDIMGRDWLKTPPPNSNVDLHVDNIIDFKDFATLAQFWLEEQLSLWP